MTVVDWGDLAERTCPICGAVMGDVLGHRRWHREQEAIDAAAVNVLRGLTELADQ